MRLFFFISFSDKVKFSKYDFLISKEVIIIGGPQKKQKI